MAEAKGMEKEGGGFKIFYQILITMLIVALIPLGGLYYISIYKSERDWTNNIRHTLAVNTDGLVRGVEDWMNMNFLLMQQNASLPAMLSMNAQPQSAVLQTIPKTYSAIYLAHTILPDGQNLGRSDGQPPNYYGDREYFKQVLAGKPMGQQVLIGKTSKKPALTLGVPINDDGGKVLGVIAVAMTLEDLSKTITKTRIGKTGFAILLDERNRLIAHGQGAVSSELQDFSSHPALNRLASLTPDSFVFFDQGKKIVALTKKTKQGWTLIVQQDYDEAYAAAKEAKQNALLLLGATLAIVLLVAFLLARRLSTPIRNLTLIADEISRGNLDATIKEKDRSDEIGALARAIDRMGVSLKMAFERLRKK